MHKSGYCIRYILPVFSTVNYITSIDKDAKRFNASRDHNKALIMSLADANKILSYFGEEGKNMKTIKLNELRELIINNPDRRFLIMDDEHDVLATWAINEIPREQPVKTEPFGATVIGPLRSERDSMEGNYATYEFDWSLADYHSDAEFILFEDKDVKEMADAMLSVFKTFPVGGDE